MPETVSECVICGHRNYTLDAAGTYLLNLPEPFNVIRCGRCDFRWLSPRPTAEEYVELYSESYFTRNIQIPADRAWIRDFPPFKEAYISDTLPRRRKHYESRLRLLRRLFPNNKRLLDVGAATGDFLDLARRYGYHVDGIEISAAACRMAMELNEILIENTDLGSFMLKDEPYDIVHLHHVFEHMTDPVGALQKIRTIMNDKSVLAIEVPNQFENWPYRVQRWYKGVDRLPRSLHSIHHPFFYSYRHILALLDQQGFEILRAKTFSFGRRLQLNRDLGNVVLGTIGWFGNRVGGYGEDIEVFATLKSSQ